MQNFTGPIFIFSIVVFLFVGFLGFGHLAMMDSSGQMSGCLLSAMATFCKMNTLEHIAAWQKLFTALTQDAIPIPILLAFLLSSILSVRALWPTKKWLETTECFHRSRLKTGASAILTPLKEAYSNGILNSKTF